MRARRELREMGVVVLVRDGSDSRGAGGALAALVRAGEERTDGKGCSRAGRGLSWPSQSEEAILFTHQQPLRQSRITLSLASFPSVRNKNTRQRLEN